MPGFLVPAIRSISIRTAATGSTGPILQSPPSGLLSFTADDAIGRQRFEPIGCFSLRLGSGGARNSCPLLSVIRMARQDLLGAVELL
jgi:hypothetical protein